MQRPYDPLSPSPSAPHTERTFDEIARPYQVATKGWLTFETVHSRDNGADDGDTVLHKAAAAGQPQDVQDLLKLGAPVESLGDMGDTPLHAAARAGQSQVVAILMDAGAGVAIRNAWGDTPVDVALKAGHEVLARDMRRAAKLDARR